MHASSRPNLVIITPTILITIELVLMSRLFGKQPPDGPRPWRAREERLHGVRGEVTVGVRGDEALKFGFGLELRVDGRADFTADVEEAGRLGWEGEALGEDFFSR